MVELTIEKALLIAIGLSIAVIIGLNLIIPLIEYLKGIV